MGIVVLRKREGTTGKLHKPHCDAAVAELVGFRLDFRRTPPLNHMPLVPPPLYKGQIGSRDEPEAILLLHEAS